MIREPFGVSNGAPGGLLVLFRRLLDLSKVVLGACKGLLGTTCCLVGLTYEFLGGSFGLLAVS